MGVLLLWLLALADAPTVSLASTSTCPSAGQLQNALAGAVPDVRVVAEPARDGDLRVELVDFGDRYQVSIDGTRRELPDPARRCEERARAAAVVIALALQPHEAPPPPAAPPPPPAPPQAVDIVVVRPAAEHRRHFDIEAAARLDTAPAADGGTAASVGVSLRAALTGSRFGLTAGVGYQSAATLQLLIPVELTRIPLDVGARMLLSSDRWQTAIDLGLVASILLLEGPQVGGNRLDLGVRAAIVERFVLRSRWSPFVGVEMAWSPRPYDLLVDGTGIEGQTPSLWLGFAAGVAMHFP